MNDNTRLMIGYELIKPEPPHVFESTRPRQGDNFGKKKIKGWQKQQRKGNRK